MALSFPHSATDQRRSTNVNVGDTIKLVVYLDTPQENKESSTNSTKGKTQTYTGTVIAKNNIYNSYESTITVRRLFQGGGCEKIFFLNSPWIKEITVLTSAKVRRSKLYYLRELAGKSARLKITSRNL
jgi:large subunit ribosomal protein L19